MATKDITDVQVCAAFAFREAFGGDAVEYLRKGTGHPYKVCLRAAERALRRDLIDYGVCIHSGFLTPKGSDLLWADLERQSKEKTPDTLR